MMETPEKTKKKLLYIDASYSLDEMRRRGMSQVLAVRLLDGYWQRVWSVHPIDNYLSAGSDAQVCGAPEIVTIAPNHLFIRGRFGFSRFLNWVTPLNFVLGQVYLAATLIRLVRREKISVVRAGDPLLCGLLAFVVARLSGARLLIRVNGNNAALRRSTGKPIMPRLFRTVAIETRVERFVFSHSDFVIGPSQEYIDFAVCNGAAAQRCQIVRFGNLIGPQHLASLDARPPLPVGGDGDILRQKPFLLHIGRLEQLKLVDHCIEVLARIVRAGHDVSLCLAGDGSYREALTQLAEERGLADRVHFLGNRSQDFLATIIPMSAVVISPLTGRALAEAAFGGAAIVAYDLDWQGELIVDGVSGCLVAANDAEAMAIAASRILSDPAFSAKLRAGARQRALEFIDPNDQTAAEIRAYEAALGRGAKA